MYLKIDRPIHRIGLISDTHTLFRPQIAQYFYNVDYIFHAGDIGKPLIIHELQRIAPTIAVLGNIDIPSWFPELQKNVTIQIAEKRLFLIHNIHDLDFDPIIAGYHAIIYGHTHKYTAHKKKGVWYVNPGSAGTPRFLIPISVAIMTIDNDLEVKQITIPT